MSGEGLLRIYVYVLVVGGVAWALSVGWLTFRAASRAALRWLKRARPVPAVRSSEG